MKVFIIFVLIVSFLYPEKVLQFRAFSDKYDRSVTGGNFLPASLSRAAGKFNYTAKNLGKMFYSQAALYPGVPYIRSKTNQALANATMLIKTQRVFVTGNVNYNGVGVSTADAIKNALSGSLR